MENRHIAIALTEKNYYYFAKGDSRRKKMHRHIVVNGKVLCGNSNAKYILDDDQSYAMKSEWDYPYCLKCSQKVGDDELICRWINEDPLILCRW